MPPDQTPTDTTIYPQGDGSRTIRLVNRGDRVADEICYAASEIFDVVRRDAIHRGLTGSARLRLRAITLEVEAIEPTDRQRRALQVAAQTRYTSHDPFASPAAVEAFFAPDTLDELLGDAAPDWTDEYRRQVIDAVIATRDHCDF